MLATRTLEFDRIVDAVTALALTPLGSVSLSELEPSTDPKVVVAAQAATARPSNLSSAILSFRSVLATRFPMRSMRSKSLAGRSSRCSCGWWRTSWTRSIRRAPASAAPATTSRSCASWSRRSRHSRSEVAAVRDAIDPGGEVLDGASPELKRIRNELRQKRQKLRGTLEQYTRGSGSKYLQDEVITESNGRFVLMVRAEHRGNVPGIVHGSSTTGATLFMEPAATVEINNDIVELEDREREEIFRILLELTDRFRARPADMTVSREVARALDVLQAKARYSSKVNGIEPEFTIDTSLQLKAARHPMLERAVPVDVLLDPPNRVLLITGPEHWRQDRRARRPPGCSR